MSNLAKTTLVAIIAFCLGAGVVWYYRDQPEAGPVSITWNDQFFDDMFDDRFFSRSRDPFQEMERFRDQIEKHFDREDSRFDSMFDDWFSGEFGDYPATAIEMNEDDENVFYELDIGTNSVANIDVQVEDGMIEINASTQSSSDPGTKSWSEFKQRFPLPAGIDPASVEVEQEDEKIVISLRKTG